MKGEEEGGEEKEKEQEREEEGKKQKTGKKRKREGRERRERGEGTLYKTTIRNLNNQDMSRKKCNTVI